jgi:hypothetical protein
MEGIIVAEVLMSSSVKVEHQRPTGLLQSLQVPEWKWEEIVMDLIVGLPRTQTDYDSIWVIMDRLTKVAHFIPVKTTYSGPQLALLYMSRIVYLHRVPKKIVSDRGTQFTLKFWEMLHETLDTQFTSILLITLRLMVRLKELIRY